MKPFTIILNKSKLRTFYESIRLKLYLIPVIEQGQQNS
jgi:hypothetical protein